jgi:transcriptional regulator with XRE-family HTH domain
MTMSAGSTTRAAVVQLRERLGLTQPEFASRLDISMPSVQRYERLVAPTGKVLAQLAILAKEAGYDDLASEFHAALIEDLGPQVMAVISAGGPVTRHKRRNISPALTVLTDSLVEFMQTAPEKLGPQERLFQEYLPKFLLAGRSNARKNTA